MSSESFSIREVIEGASSKGLNNSDPDPHLRDKAVLSLALIFDRLNAKDIELMPFRDVIDVELPPETVCFTWGPASTNSVMKETPGAFLSAEYLSASTSYVPYSVKIYRNRPNFELVYGNRRYLQANLISAILIEETSEEDRHIAITLSNAITGDGILRVVIVNGFSSQTLRGLMRTDGTAKEAALSNQVEMPAGLFSLLVISLAYEMALAFNGEHSPHLMRERELAMRDYMTARERTKDIPRLRFPGFPMS